MSSRADIVLKRLNQLGFDSQAGTLAPFGEEFPLVQCVAWDRGTAQLALICELDDGDSDDAWQQLLFAASGLRHQLTTSGPTAFGVPVVLAIVDEVGEARLREISENLAANYTLFTRVDLNLVRHENLADQDALDLALAPLLPKCREMRGQEISKAEVQKFWDVLRAEVHATAMKLDDVFAPYRESAARDSLEMLIPDSAGDVDLPAPEPRRSLDLRDFRSFESEHLDLAAVTVLHGPNGGGKTSIVEALELSWAGRSQRQPDDVPREIYARHLARDGGNGFEVQADGQSVTELAETLHADLGRAVLAQDAIDEIVARSPSTRYEYLLKLTGLEIPDLAARTEALVNIAKAEADAALTSAGLPKLPRRDSVALRHLTSALGSAFTSVAASSEAITAYTRALAGVAPFKGWRWDDERAASALAQADAAVARAITDHESAPVIQVLDDARDVVSEVARSRSSAAEAVRTLLSQMRVAMTTPVGPSAPPHHAEQVKSKPTTSPRSDGLDTHVIVRWLAHRRSLIDGAKRFRADAEQSGGRWQRILTEYADALDGAAELVPAERLERLVKSSAFAVPSSTIESPASAPAIPLERFTAAGFSEAVHPTESLIASLSELLDVLDTEADAFLGLVRELEIHPARCFDEHAPQVLRALCRFELARTLRRPKGPVPEASEKLVTELLQDRLAPLLRELVAATVRFDWYFKPLEVPASGREIVLGGLATSRPELDARLVLNAAERTVVGLAWFLAMFLLQPKDRRQVLVLDDPTGGFDITNQAGFTSTLRAFVRLIQPDQVIVTTHDDALAAILAEELVPVDGWPQGVNRIRCQRDERDASRAHLEWQETESRTVAAEYERLGIGGGALFA